MIIACDNKPSKIIVMQCFLPARLLYCSDVVYNGRMQVNMGHTVFTGSVDRHLCSWPVNMGSKCVLTFRVRFIAYLLSVCCLDVSTSAVDSLKRLVSDMISHVLTDSHQLTVIIIIITIIIFTPLVV